MIKPIDNEYKTRAKEECARTGNSRLFDEVVCPNSRTEPRDEDGTRFFCTDMLKTLALAVDDIDLYYILTGQRRG